MGKKHSDLEMFMRKMMSQLGLGYQCYYKNRAHNHHRQGHPGHWSIRVWDQRPGHYAKANKKDVHVWDFCIGKEHAEPRMWKGNRLLYCPGPEQKWHQNQHSDCEFEVIGPEYQGVGAEHKDEFLAWLLFDGNLFKSLAMNLGSEFGAKGNKSLSGISLMRAICDLKGDDYSSLTKELNVLKEKYGW